MSIKDIDFSKVKSAPYYFNYLSQTDNDDGLAEKVIKDHGVAWVADLEKRLDEKFSSDFHSDDFPVLDLWPAALQFAYHAAKKDKREKMAKFLEKAKKFTADAVTIYTIDNRVFISTPHYCNCEIIEAESVDGGDAISAANEYISDYKAWESAHKKIWQLVDLESNRFAQVHE